MKYNKNVLDLLDRISGMSENKIILSSKGDSIVSSSRNNSFNPYILRFEKELFDFTDKTEKIFFTKFNEFYQLVNTFESPDIGVKVDSEIDRVLFEVSKDTNKIRYATQDPDILSKNEEIEKFGFKNLLASFDLSSSVIKELKKFANLLDIQQVKLTSKDSSVNVLLHNSNHSNSYEKKLELEDNNKDFDFNISKTSISILPDLNYRVSIFKETDSDGDSEHFVKFDYMNDDNIDLGIVAREFEADF